MSFQLPRFSSHDILITNQALNKSKFDEVSDGNRLQVGTYNVAFHPVNSEDLENDETLQQGDIIIFQEKSPPAMMEDIKNTILQEGIAQYINHYDSESDGKDTFASTIKKL